MYGLSIPFHLLFNIYLYKFDEYFVLTRFTGHTIYDVWKTNKNILYMIIIISDNTGNCIIKVFNCHQFYNTES